mgnify:CR=1 FL=1
MSSGFKIHKMIDKTDKFATKMDNNLFDLPMRLLLAMPSGSGKSNFLANLFLKHNGYRSQFLPERIFIFSASIKGDEKMRIMTEELDVPQENIFDNYDDEILSTIYDMLVDDFCDNVEEGVKNPKLLNSVIIFDDLAFGDSMKASTKDSMLKKIFMNGRKFNISCVVISQKYSSIGTVLRENATGIVMSRCSNKQLELLDADHNYLKEGKKAFRQMFLDATDKKFSYFIINFSKPELYFDTNFKPLM